MSALVVNLYGGPGVGKNSMCAGLFHDLKAMGISVEMAREFAKEALWEGRLHLLEKPAYQIYLFAKQLKLIVDLNEKVDVIVTDSPLLLSLVYAPTNEALKALVVQENLRFDNLDLFLTRDKPYDQKGRTQNEGQALALDLQMARAYTTAVGHGPHTVSGNVEGKDLALAMILRRLDERIVAS